MRRSFRGPRVIVPKANEKVAFGASPKLTNFRLYLLSHEELLTQDSGSNLVLFYLLGQLQVPLGVPFFLWVGIFNLLIVAQFWSFANDLYLEEQGKRLFPIIAFGGSFGAILGPKIAGWLFEPSGPYGLMLMTALLLGFCMVFSNRVNRRAAHERRNAQRALDPETLGPTRRIQTGPRPTLSSHHCSDDDRCESSQHDGRVHSRPESHGGSETTRGGRNREPGRS